MSNLLSIYEAKCAEFDVRKNSAVVELLKAGDTTDIDLSVNIVGSKGLLPLLQVAKQAPRLRSLNLSNNRLSSPAAVEISQLLMGHPALSSLDLSNNHLALGGEPILNLTKGTPSLLRVNTENTLVRPLFVKLIDFQLQKNQRALENGGTNGASSPEMHTDPGVSSPTSPLDFSTFKLGDGSGDDGDSNEASDEDDGADDECNSEEDLDEEEEAAAAARSRALLGSSGRRKTVSSEVISQQEMQSFRPKVISKPQEDVAWLCKGLEQHNLFSHLEDQELLLAVNAMEEATYSKGDTLLCEGEEEERVYIVRDGEAEETRQGKSLRQVGPGEAVGETAVLYSSALDTSVSVVSDSLRAFSLDRSTYRHIVTKSSHDKRKRYSAFLQKISFLKEMPIPSLLQLADALKSSVYKKGDVLIEHGSEGEWFHIITEGTVEVIGRKGGEKVQVCTFTEGDCVGELEFINPNTVCVADVLAQTAEVRTAKMNRRHFEKVMGPCIDILKRVADTSEVYEYYRGTRQAE